MSGAAADRHSTDAGVNVAPEEALSHVWMLLDELPRASASAALTATTIEMAAVAADAAVRGPRVGARAWLGPAAVIAAALVGGMVAGHVTAPDPDRRLLENLPLVRHLDLLREAGSVTFLEKAAGRGAPPLRMELRQGPEAARQDTTEFAAELEALGRLVHADTAARRDFVADLPVEEQAELERSLREFSALSSAERKTLAAVAEALVDPTRPDVRAAALDWHRWLASSRPEDRAGIVAAGTDKRLDWIDWYASRIEGRGRQGPPPWVRRPPGGEPPRGPEGRGRRPPPGPGPERQEGPPGEGAEPAGPPRGAPEGAGPPPPLRPDAPPPPPETRAPPG